MEHYPTSGPDNKEGLDFGRKANEAMDLIWLSTSALFEHVNFECRHLGLRANLL
jgi:hypothetical protein